MARLTCARRRGARGSAAVLALVATGWLSGCGGADATGGDEVAGAASDTALRRLAAELLPEAELRSGLPARGPIQLATRSREDLEAFLVAQMAEQLPADRLRAVVRTYARLGLVPEDIDLEPLLRSLLLEQVVGYYDPARDTLYVVDRVDASQVEPVLLHEIVHALQDQYVDLDSLMKANLDANDRGTAAQAALEGHATFAMLEWQLAGVTGGNADLTTLPGLEGLLGDDPLAAAGIEMPVLADAPAVIRESLLFPYLGGLIFLQKHWAGPWGRVPPLGPDMPVSTEQVLHPEKFGRGQADMPTDVRFLEEPPAGWTEVYADDLGELETRLLLREFLPDREEADRAAAGWDGDRFRFLDGPSGEVLVWASVWDTDRDALEFETGMRRALTERYGGDPLAEGREIEVLRGSEARRPVVVVWDLPAGLDRAAGLESLTAFELEEQAALQEPR
ncbi:MAG: hypothetical protein HKP01_01535 [Gemmatimonadetes bacterium]|nr:hypothetical protein [Gemmatimonadota bacterium]